MLGGISGKDAKLTTDESPERVAAVQRLSLAYLRSILYPEDPAWRDTRARPSPVKKRLRAGSTANKRRTPQRGPIGPA